MKVRLFTYSQIDPDYEGELTLGKSLSSLVAYCARVSNPSNQANTETEDKLIAYLLKHKHFSPFEMVSMTLEIVTTRDIARQILRHRSFSFQEFSQRYANPVKDLEFEYREARLQDTKNRQNSIALDLSVADNRELNNIWIEKQQRVIRNSRNAYEWAIDNGIAKEQARSVLPEGLMQSKLYMAGTLRSWLHYVELRSANGTQIEHQEIAKACAKVISKVFPPAAGWVESE